MDFRSPEEIEADGGMLAMDPNGDGSAIDHVKELLGEHDPWVSTTTHKRVAVVGAKSPGNVYVYFINPSGRMAFRRG